MLRAQDVDMLVGDNDTLSCQGHWIFWVLLNAAYSAFHEKPKVMKHFGLVISLLLDCEHPVAFNSFPAFGSLMFTQL